MNYKKIAIKSLIFSIVFYLILYVLIQSEMSKYEDNIITIDLLKTVSKTGDIVYFRWTFIDVALRLFTKFSHAGVVYKDPSTQKLYILELHPEGDGLHEDSESGVHLYDLEERVKEYKGTCYYSQLLHTTDRGDIIKTKLQDYCNIDFDENFRYNYVKAYLNHKLGKQMEPKNSMYCSEFIGHVLKDIGVLNKSVNTSILSPSSFETLDIYNEIQKISPNHSS